MFSIAIYVRDAGSQVQILPLRPNFSAFRLLFPNRGFHEDPLPFPHAGKLDRPILGPITLKSR
jgi:hypothetical protein